MQTVLPEPQALPDILDQLEEPVLPVSEESVDRDRLEQPEEVVLKVPLASLDQPEEQVLKAQQASPEQLEPRVNLDQPVLLELLAAMDLREQPEEVVLKVPLALLGLPDQLVKEVPLGQLDSLVQLGEPEVMVLQALLAPQELQVLVVPRGLLEEQDLPEQGDRGQLVTLGQQECSVPLDSLVQREELVKEVQLVQLDSQVIKD